MHLDAERLDELAPALALLARNAAICELTGRPEDAVSLVCTGPITYVGQEEIKADIAHLKAAAAGVAAEEAFVTAISPTNLEMYFENRYY